MARCYVGLGSNLGDRAARLVAARAGLAAADGVEVVAASRIYETEPVGPPQPRYLNAVLALETALEARELLDLLQALERAADRRRDGERNGPRTLDLDLLLHGSAQICEPGLELPHPRMHQRAFVLEPLAELAPELRLPGQALDVKALAQRLGDPAAVHPWKEDGAWPSSP